MFLLFTTTLTYLNLIIKNPVSRPLIKLWSDVAINPIRQKLKNFTSVEPRSSGDLLELFFHMFSGILVALCIVCT